LGILSQYFCLTHKFTGMKNTFLTVHPLNQGLAAMMLGEQVQPKQINQTATIARQAFNCGGEEQKEQTLEILRLGGSSHFAQFAYHPSMLCLSY
jgi:hypothetical protein